MLFSAGSSFLYSTLLWSTPTYELWIEYKTEREERASVGRTRRRRKDKADPPILFTDPLPAGGGAHRPSVATCPRPLASVCPSCYENERTGRACAQETGRDRAAAPASIHLLSPSFHTPSLPAAWSLPPRGSRQCLRQCLAAGSGECLRRLGPCGQPGGKSSRCA